MLCTGVYLIAWTFNAHADVIVKAIVKDKPIAAPAVITTPADNTHFTAVPIEISGTCPDHAAYVEIFRNGIMDSSAMCINGKFDPQVDLFAGKNIIEAHSFNLTDDEGPVSGPVTVYYDPPPPPSPPSLQTSSPSPSKSTAPLLLNTAFVYKGYYVGQEVSWPLEISGGTEPYALNVDWGDGKDSIISRPQAGRFNITHTYESPGTNHGSYTIKVQASDAEGNYAYMQFFVIISQKTTQSIGSSGNIYSKGPPSLGGLHDWVWAAWPLYLSLVLMTVSFKLGEREEFIMLRKRHQLRRS